MTQNQSGCLVPTTLRGAGGGSDAVKLRCVMSQWKPTVTPNPVIV